MNMNKILSIILGSLLLAVPFIAKAQTDTTSEQDETSGPTILPPLFEYPVVPEDITDWKARNNWLVEHFWDNFDFKQKSVGQAQLNHAFKTFTVPMRFADAGVALKSIDKLISKLKKQPGLLLQFTMAAERSTYDPNTSEAIIDEIYLPFLKALAADKKLPNLRKARYAGQLKALDGCLVGDIMKSFEFDDRNGVRTCYNPTAEYTIIEFGDPTCSECRIMKLRMETDAVIKQAAADGKLKIMFIIPDADPDEGDEWRAEVIDYPHFWTVGAASDLEETVDLRYTPCIYVIGPDKKILSKNAGLEEIHTILESATVSSEH